MPPLNTALRDTLSEFPSKRKGRWSLVRENQQSSAHIFVKYFSRIQQINRVLFPPADDMACKADPAPAKKERHAAACLSFLCHVNIMDQLPNQESKTQSSEAIAVLGGAATE